MAHLSQEEEERMAIVSDVELSVPLAEDVPTQTPLKKIFVIGAIVSMVGFVGSVVIARPFTAAPKSTSEGTTARNLLESTDVAGILAENVMALDHVDASQKDAVSARAGEAVHSLSASLREHEPEVYRRLNSVQLSDQQQASSLRFVRSLGDVRAHKLRKEIIAAIQLTVQESGDRESLKRHLAEKLGLLSKDVRHLRDVYFPEHIGGPADNERAIEAQHFENTQLVQLFDRWHALQKSGTLSSQRKLQTTASELTMVEKIEEMWLAFKEKLAAMNPFKDSNTGEAVEAAEQSTFACLAGAVSEPSTLSTCWAEFVDMVKQTMGMGNSR